MSKYIDADALLMELDMTEDLSAYDAIVFEEMVKEQPTADVVEVIRCKDCKHRPYLDKDGFIEPENSICPCINEDDPYYSWMPEDDWFCADGERREDGR